MFGLSEAHFNLVKQAAKNCAREIKDAIDAGKKYDDCAADIISKYHNDKIHLLVTRLRFVWLIGYFNGRMGKLFDYE
ncbi:hypothetical protein [Hafnia phage Pocis76]|uniref:Uncharacterized protein n=1 Tax=Hafnia phage Pocis76 TaxID=2831174 RepID=A0A8E7FN60_9CAUD|nr:hypothetical protein [Hafnia phage Pocis76]